MTQEHPITPPPELVLQWCAHSNEHENYDQFWRHIATQAARWGADQELEACCKWVDTPVDLEDCRPGEESKHLRATRRPKPPSDKEQSIALINKIQANKEMWQTEDLDVVLRALEALPDNS